MLENTKGYLYRFLRWSERYTKTDMVYFMQGNFWLNASRGMSIINGLILSIAFAHLLTKEAYGTYTYALALMGLFSMPQSTALGAGMVKGVARGEDGIVLEGLRYVFPYSIAGALMLGGLGLYYWFMHNVTLAAVFVVGAAALPISVINGSAKSVFSAKGDFGPMTRFTLLRTPPITLLLITVMFFTHSALWVLIANTLGSLLLSTLLYVYMRQQYDLHKPLHTTEHFDKKYAFHSGVLSIFTYLSGQLDDILLWKFLGAAPVAIYTYAFAPVRELRSIIENQSTIAMPKFAQRTYDEVRKIVLFRIRQMYLIALPLTAVYIFSAPYIFHFLFPQYSGSVLFSQVAAISLLSAPRRLINGAISAHQRIRESYIMIVMPNIIRIILASLLIPLFGIWGAVYALLISEIIDFFTLGLLMRGFK